MVGNIIMIDHSPLACAKHDSVLYSFYGHNDITYRWRDSCGENEIRAPSIMYTVCRS
jgi:hypothetical protein